MKLRTLMICLCCANLFPLKSINAQNLITDAVLAISNQQYEEGLSKLDSAIAQDMNMSVVYYYRAIAAKDLMKNATTPAEKKKYGNIALSSVETIFLSDSNTYTADALKIAKYVLSHMYNQAAVAVSSHHLASAEDFYNIYTKYFEVFYPNMDLNRRHEEFYSSLSSAYTQLALETPSHQKDSLLLRALETRKKALGFNSGTYMHLYNAGVICYNLSQLSNADKKKYWLNEALTYLNQAYQLSANKTTVSALKQVHTDLGNDAMASFYEKKLGEPD